MSETIKALDLHSDEPRILTLSRPVNAIQFPGAGGPSLRPVPLRRFQVGVMQTDTDLDVVGPGVYWVLCHHASMLDVVSALARLTDAERESLLVTRPGRES